jgi:hypothetical protein
MTKCSIIKIGGVVKSFTGCTCPPQADCSIFQALGILHCMALFLKKYYTLYMNLFI